MDIELVAIAKGDTDEDGYPTIQIQGLGKSPTNHTSPAYFPSGIISQPIDPDLDSNGQPLIGPQAFEFQEGNDSHIFPLSDPRLVGKLPPRKGGTFIAYGAVGSTPADATKTPSILMFDSSKHGSLMCLVPHQSGSTSSGIFIDVSTKDAEAVQIRHGLGMGIAIVAGGKNPIIINNKAGDGFFSLDDSGIVLNGAKISIMGALLAGDPASAEALAKATPLLAWIVGALIPALAGAPGGPIVVAPPGPFATTKVFGV